MKIYFIFYEAKILPKINVMLCNDPCESPVRLLFLAKNHLMDKNI